MSAGLFGEMPDKKMRRRARREASAVGVRQCFDRFAERFQARHHKKPIFAGGKDGKLFKRLIDVDGVEAVLSLIDEFFETSEPFIVMSDYSVGAFYVSAQRLRIRLTRITDRRLAENAEAAQRASRGES